VRCLSEVIKVVCKPSAEHFWQDEQLLIISLDINEVALKAGEVAGWISP
jgi:hypothetical protein